MAGILHALAAGLALLPRTLGARVAKAAAVSSAVGATGSKRSRKTGQRAKRDTRDTRDKSDRRDTRDKSDPARRIKREKDLAPRRDYELDDEVAQSEEGGAGEALGAGPLLTEEELQRRETESLVDEKIEEEIGLAIDLLAIESGCEATQPVRFRLADLYWEKSKREFFKANAGGIAVAERKLHNDAMSDLQARTMAAYGQIIDECPQHEDLPRVLFHLGRTLLEVGRPREAVAYFGRIIAEFPGSPWEGQAWFMQGETYFNTAGDAYAALRAYKKATQFRDLPNYGYAVYKQGWCHVNTADWDLAMERFAVAAGISHDERAQLDERARKLLRREALKDYVRAYSHVGAARDALRTFAHVGGQQAATGMLEQLGQWYASQGAHADLVAVYRTLIRRAPQSGRVPLWQAQIVDAISSSGAVRDTIKEVEVLARFLEAARARVATAGEDEARELAKAEEAVEATIRRLATGYHKDGKKLRGRARDKAYEDASALYDGYLRLFARPAPGSDVNYALFMAFYSAEVLFQLGRYESAARRYDAVASFEPPPIEARERELVAAAAEEAVRSYDAVVAQLDREVPPVIGGNDAKPIPEIKQRLLDACRRYVDRVGASGDTIVEIRYKMARIYYTYNHFDEAAPAFDDIVENHPEHAVACYAANLALDIYNGQKNYQALRDKGRAYMAAPKLACGPDDRRRFAEIAERSSFQWVKTLFEDKGAYLEAARAYEQFVEQYPNSELVDDAIYNASVNYDLGNRLDQANQMRRLLVDKEPDSPLVPETLYNLARSYERVVDFADAAQFLERFAERFPKDPRSKDAMYNAGVYRATLRDFTEAKRTRERFLALYANDPEAPRVALSICETLEQQAQVEQESGASAVRARWQAAHDCYADFARNRAYVSRQIDLVCHAQFRRGEVLATELKDAKGAKEQQDALLKAWPRWQQEREHGSDKLPRCTEAIAQLQTRAVQAELERYLAMRIAEVDPSERGMKRFDASVKAKAGARDALVAAYTDVVQLGVARWSLAALYHIGLLHSDAAHKLLQAKIPDKVGGFELTDDEKAMAREHLKRQAAPSEAAAVAAFQLCVGKANELGVYNEWSLKAQTALSRALPAQYPPLEERLVELQFDGAADLGHHGLLLHAGDDVRAVERAIVFPAPQPPSSGPPVAAPATPATPDAPAARGGSSRGGP